MEVVHRLGAPAEWLLPERRNASQQRLRDFVHIAPLRRRATLLSLRCARRERGTRLLPSRGCHPSGGTAGGMKESRLGAQ